MRIELTRRQAADLVTFIAAEGWRMDDMTQEALDDLRQKIEKKLGATQE